MTFDACGRLAVIAQRQSNRLVSGRLRVQVPLAALVRDNSTAE